LFGTLFVPLQAVQASFLSSLFSSNQVYADTDTTSNTVAPPQSQSGDNLQNPSAALQISDPSQVNNIQNNDDSSSTTTIDDSGTAISAPTGPMGVSDGTNAPDCSGTDANYVVKSGDSIAWIAKTYNVSVNTILWANNMKKGDKLTTGEVLLILPCSGVEYTIKSKDSLKSIAKLYKVDVNDIVQNNDITLNTPLVPGDTLIIPNATKFDEGGTPIPTKNLGASIAKDKLFYEQHPIQNLAGYYIDPVPGYRLSQGLHDNNAVDLAVSVGTPIHAAADGKVILARTGYNGGFGNLVIIDHPNGTQTLYAHQSKILTQAGAEVFQGQVIGLTGGKPGAFGSGHSTGPHLHFEVHGAQNPGVDGSWKY
jgi:murein DD-endopeptidase MepM/ murein hydrolase activator NlpD